MVVGNGLRMVARGCHGSPEVPSGLKRCLDDMDRRILEALVKKFNGGPVGLESLAVAISEDAKTIEEVYEPYLIKEGFIQRTSRGRIAQDKACNYFT